MAQNRDVNICSVCTREIIIEGENSDSGSKNKENTIASSDDLTRFCKLCKNINLKSNCEINNYPNWDANILLRSCKQEIAEPITGTTTGVIPSWLKGSLLRNGAGLRNVGNEYFQHIFDGSALLHRFRIEAGGVTYQCRFLQSEAFIRNRAANRIVLTEFGTKATPDPCRTIFQRVAAAFCPQVEDVSDNALVSLYPLGDEIYAFGENPVIHRVDPESLETEARVKLRDFVSIVHHTSHPHIANDGSVYNLGLSIYPSGPYHSIVKFPPKDKGNTSRNCFEQASVVANIPARWRLHPSYMHSFGMTDNFFIIVEQPFNVSVAGVMKAKIINDPIIGSFQWYPEEKTQINLIDRTTGELAYKFFSESFFFMHIINQYEICEHVVVDICTYRDPAIIEGMYINAVKNMQQDPNYAEMFRSKSLRFVLPLKPAKSSSNLIHLKGTSAEAYFMADGEVLVKPETLTDLGCEVPTINYKHHSGKTYRFFYAMSTDVDVVSSLIKVDTVTKTSKTWSEDNCYPSEPIFVPRPDHKAEDDGVILSVMLWCRDDTNRVGLLVLDAQTFEEIGRAEFRTPGPVPRCLHGMFLSKKAPL